MKFTARLKRVSFFIFITLYLSGLLVWIFDRWFTVDRGFGVEPSPWRVVWLQSHSILSLGFLILFGYIFHAHIEPSWRRHKRRRTGALFTAVVSVMILTVPGLFYLVDGAMKNGVVAIHTYLGLATVLFFSIHYFRRSEPRTRRRASASK